MLHDQMPRLCLDAEALAEGLQKALLHTERTTGRVDTAHLSNAVLVHQVITMYEWAIRNKRGRHASLSLEGEPLHENA